jgi:hypothetical protein
VRSPLQRTESPAPRPGWNREGWASCQVPADERKPTVGQFSQSRHVTPRRNQGDTDHPEIRGRVTPCNDGHEGAGRPGAWRRARTSYHPVMKTSGITAAVPAQDLGRAKAFYVETVGLQALESDFLKARDGQVGFTVGDGVSQLFVYPARARSSGEFTQAVIHVTDMRAAVGEMRGSGVEFEEYDTPDPKLTSEQPRRRI